MNVVELGTEIKRRRRELGWSLAELARRAGTSAPTIHRYESGWRRFEVYTLAKLATALGCRLVVSLEPLRSEPGTDRTATADRLRRLFWDRPLIEDDLERFPEWVALRVLEYGSLADVATLRAHWGRERFLDVVEGLHFSSRKTRVFWDAILRREGRTCRREFSRREAESSWTF